MSSMVVMLRWSWLLSISLLAPIALPAGGGERNQLEIRKRDLSEPFLSEKSASLKASPFAIAPSLCKLKVGTPFRLVRHWQNEDGVKWIYVQVISSESGELVSFVRHGWIHV